MKKIKNVLKKMFVFLIKKRGHLKLTWILLKLCCYVLHGVGLVIAKLSKNDENFILKFSSKLNSAIEANSMENITNKICSSLKFIFGSSLKTVLTLSCASVCAAIIVIPAVVTSIKIHKDYSKIQKGLFSLLMDAQFKNNIFYKFLNS